MLKESLVRFVIGFDKWINSEENLLTLNIAHLGELEPRMQPNSNYRLLILY